MDSFGLRGGQLSKGSSFVFWPIGRLPARISSLLSWLDDARCYERQRYKLWLVSLKGVLDISYVTEPFLEGMGQKAMVKCLSPLLQSEMCRGPQQFDQVTHQAARGSITAPSGILRGEV